MSFATPWGLAVAALAVPLTLWYVLRARRPRVAVSSTFLWRQTDRSVAAAVPWQRFRPDRTYWLVLAAILTGALALATPTIAAPAELGDHTILLLDTSASMQAVEDGPSRLEVARRAARDLVDKMGPQQVVSVIAAGPRARVLLAGSGDAGAARRALDAAQPSGGASDLADAFTLAASLQRPGEETVTHLFTDGPVDGGVAALAPPGLVVDGVGSDRPNLAVTRLQALPGGAAGAGAFVQVRNLGQLSTEAVVTLSLDGAEVARRDVTLGPRETEDLVVEVGVPAAGAGILHARVTPKGRDAAGDVSADALAVDDNAVALLSGRRRVRALIAGPGNVFVESALAAVEGVQVRTAPAVPSDLTAIDLLVVDGGVAPSQPAVPTLYIAPRRPPADVTIQGRSELPALTFQDPAAELLADVDLSGVAIAAAQRVDAPTLQAVAAAPDTPLLLTGRIRGTSVVYIPFALGDSNLPLQVAWPVLVANTVNALAGPPTAPALVAGTTTTLPVPSGATSATAVAPGGQEFPVDPERPQIRLDVPGVWEVRYGGTASPSEASNDGTSARTLLAVNSDPAESDLARGRPQPLEVSGERSDASAPPPAGRRRLSQYLLVLPLALLVVEGLNPVAQRWLRARPRTRPPRRRGPRRRKAAGMVSP